MQKLDFDWHKLVARDPGHGFEDPVIEGGHADACRKLGSGEASNLARSMSSNVAPSTPAAPALERASA